MRFVRLALFLVCSTASYASAQTPTVPPIEDVPLSRINFTFGWSIVASSDPRFDWRAEIGADVDLVDYDTGRVRLRADYEGILGGERRVFDLNQGVYSFDLSASGRVKQLEFAPFLAHQSRHTVDRENPQSVSWNMLGGRMDFHGGKFLAGGVEAGAFFQQAFVDYRAAVRAHAKVAHPVRPTVDVILGGRSQWIWTDPEIADRDLLIGGRIEGGIRVNGRAAAIEIIAAYDDRIDAYPTQRLRKRWFEVGFRLVGR